MDKHLNLIVIVHNIRSTHNVGAILRTAEGLGVDEVWLTGYTPFPVGPNDPRLPHLAAKISRQIGKTSLGAENSVKWRQFDDINQAITQLKSQKYRIVGLEQDPSSIPLPNYRPAGNVALLLGEEVAGVEPELLRQCDDIVEIPMFGRKESFNVSVAAGMAMYEFVVLRLRP